MWAHLIAQPLDRKDRFDGVSPRQKIFRLKFLSCAGRKAHAEVRQPVVPWPGDAHLLVCSSRRKRADWMQVSGCKLGQKNSRGAAKAPAPPMRLLIQTSLMRWFCQSVNKLTL